MNIMSAIDKAFLYKLLETPSPSGFEQPVQRLIRERMKKYADSIETDYHGNVIVGLNTKAERRVMLSGHCDQIGLMVKQITNDGFILVSAIGGIDVGVLHASRVTIYSSKGEVPGVIGRKPIHKQTAEERDRTKNDLEKIWIDIGAKNKKEAEKKVSIGDPITFELRVLELDNQLFAAPGLDNKTGAFIVMEALRLCAQENIKVALYSVSTVQEEIGIRGAVTSTYSVNPEVGIAVDVGLSTDSPASEGTKDAPLKLGSGPGLHVGANTNPVVGKMLGEAAKKAKKPSQIIPAPKTLGTDAANIQLSRGGVATGGIAIPNRYMHSQVEVCNLKDIEAAVMILVNFVESINGKTDFRPM